MQQGLPGNNQLKPRLVRVIGADTVWLIVSGVDNGPSI